MTDELLLQVVTELRGIRAALEKPKPLGSLTTFSSSSKPIQTSLPLPEVWIENAGEVAVHFGKNAGTAISSLNDKQLLWYGAERAPSLKNDGTPFPPKDSDTLLKNACRTLWHDRLKPSQKSIDIVSNKPAVTEEVPF